MAKANKADQQLIPLENVTAKDLFGGADENKLNDLMANIKKAAELLAGGLDVEKADDRKEMASVAYKVARSKTTIDDAGKDFVADLKSQCKIVDARRRDVREQLDALRDEIRGPLNRWEENEQARIQGHTDAIAAVRASGNEAMELYLTTPLEDLRAGRKLVEDVNPDESEEFAENMAETRLAALGKIDTAITKREEHDAEQAELEQLRKEKAEREERDRQAAEEQRQKEHDEKVRKEAEEKAEREAKEEREKLEREKQEAEERAAAAEREAAEAEELAMKEHEEKLAREKEEKERRERNTRYKGQCNSEAAEALIQHAKLDATQARKVVEAIVKGKIPRVTLEY